MAVSKIQNAIAGLVVPAGGSNSLVITGTPTATGTETFTVTATDTLGAAISTNYSITVSAGISIGPTALFAGTVNVACHQTLFASNGQRPTPGGAPVTVAMAVSNIQNAIAGLIVPASGSNSLSITGTPTAIGTETFTVTATDAQGDKTSASYGITVNNPTWNGSATGNLSNAANWAAGVAPNPAIDTLVLGGSTASTPVNDFPAGSAFLGLIFNGGCTLSGNSAVLGSTIANAQGSNSVSLPLVLGGDGLFQVSAGALAVGGTIDNGGHLLTVNTADSSSAIISGPVSGAGGLVKSGTGTLTLSGANTYSGDTVVSAGTLITDPSSMPSGGNLTVSAGGVFIFAGSAAAATTSSSSGVILNAAAALAAQSPSPAAGSSQALALPDPGPSQAATSAVVAAIVPPQRERLPAVGQRGKRLVGGAGIPSPAAIARARSGTPGARRDSGRICPLKDASAYDTPAMVARARDQPQGLGRVFNDFPTSPASER